MSLSGGRPFCMFGSCREALPIFGSGRETLPTDWKWAVGPLGGPGVVRSPSQMSGMVRRPSQMSGSDWETSGMSGSGLEAVPDVREWT